MTKDYGLSSVAVFEGPVTTEIDEIYRDAAREGIFFREYREDNGTYIAAACSLYMFQQMEEEQRQSIVPEDLTMSQVMAISVPGQGPSRAEALRAAVERYKTTGMYTKLPHAQVIIVEDRNELVPDH
jgi:hypothetical protein